MDTPRITLAALCVASTLVSANAATILSGFDVSVDGWTQSGAATFQHEANGGNPDGHLYIDNSDLAITYIYAPEKFRGDLNAFIGGTVSFDGKTLGLGGTP